MSLYYDLGGEAPLRAVLDDFYQRVFADPMIGYLFMGQKRERLVQLEFELTARLLGGPVTYTGRPMRKAHEKHNIRKGHFHRRNQLMLDTLRDHDVPAPIVEAWMAHARALERAILTPAARRDRHCDADVPPDPDRGLVEVR